ncbi:MAG: hypothetical protein KTR21_12150 [Rhodobacteraceae bacterium]|nr:hypothetical protein [Paracoccaceae bacterium]
MGTRESDAVGVAHRRNFRVITVHGTFDKNATWDNEDQFFVSTLRQDLAAGGADLSVKNLEWDGDNNHDIRRAGADKLMGVMREELAKPEYDEVFIVGHSHGGTVARMAVNSLEPDEKRPSGVFTFGSPFLRFKPRSVRFMTSTLQWLVLGIGGLISLALLFFAVLALLVAIGPETGQPLVDGGGSQSGSKTTNMVVLSLITAVAIGVTVLLHWLIRRWRRALEREQHRICGRYDPPEGQPVGYVCYHAYGDEAGVLLRFWGFFTWIMQTAIFILLYGAVAMLAIGFCLTAIKVFDMVAEQDLWALVMTPVVNALFALGDLIAPGETSGGLSASEMSKVLEYLPSYVLGTAVITLGLMLVLALIVAPFALLIPWLLRRQYFAFGGEAFSWSLICDINADRLPNSRSEMKSFFLLPAAYFGKKFSMQHNYYYNDSRVITDMASRMLNWSVEDRGAGWDLEQVFLRGLRYFLVALLVVLVLGIAVARTAGGDF